MSINGDIQLLSPGAIVTLWEIDATSLGGDIVRLTNWSNEVGTGITWQGNLYSRFPIEGSDFDWNSQGSIPRPKLTVANITQDIAVLLREHDDLVGAKVTRKRTFGKYLDAVNFEGGVNADADPNMYFADEIWYIDQKTVENRLIIEFELAANWDVQNIMLPRRQIVRNMCQWVYRSAECSYAGPAVATINDEPTTDGALDDCGKRCYSCKLRFGDGEPLPFGGFAGAVTT